jgi:hypothetical protein
MTFLFLSLNYSLLEKSPENEIDAGPLSSYAQRYLLRRKSTDQSFAQNGEGHKVHIDLVEDKIGD